MTWTKLGMDIAAPTTIGGAARSVDNAEMQTWMTEAEQQIAAFGSGASTRTLAWTKDSNNVYYAAWPPYNVSNSGGSGAATANIAAINQAITDCAAAGGGTVVLPPGSIYINAAIILKSGVTLYGAGFGTNVIATAKSFFMVFIGDQGPTTQIFRGGVENLQLSNGALGILFGKFCTLSFAKRVWLSGCDSGIIHRGNYNTSRWTASISGTTMTVTAVSTGTVETNRFFSGTGVTSGTYIVSQLTGSAGSTGTYQVSTSQTVSSTTMTTIVDDCFNNFIQDICVSDYQTAFQSYHCGEIYLERFLPIGPRTAAFGIILDTTTVGVHMTSCNVAGPKFPITLQSSVGFTANAAGYDTRPAFIFADRVLADTAGAVWNEGTSSIGWNIAKAWQVHLVNCWGSGSKGDGVVIGAGGTNDVNDIEFMGGAFTLNATNGIKISGAQADLGLKINGGVFHGNGYSTSNTYDDIYIPAGVVGVSIEGISGGPGTGSGYTAANRYGVNVVAGASDYIRIEPSCRLNGVTAPLLFGATGSNCFNGYGATTKLIRRTIDQSSAAQTGTTLTPYDNTIPQVTEGTQFASKVIQPRTAGAKFRVRVTACVANSTAGWVTAHLHLDGAANAFAAMPTYIAAANAPFILTFSADLTINDLSAHTVTLRAGPSTSATLTYSPATLGGVIANTIEIDEYT